MINSNFRFLCQRNKESNLFFVRELIIIFRKGENNYNSTLSHSRNVYFILKGTYTRTICP